MDFIKQKILITGADGFLGSCLVKELLAGGAFKKNLFLPTVQNLDLKIWEDCKKAVIGQDIVIHLAGIVVSRREQEKRAAEIFYTNLMINSQIIEAARLAGVKKIITIGSITEYPRDIEAPFREESLWNGYSEKENVYYGITKRIMSTQIFSYNQQYDLNGIHLILPNLYGPKDKFHHSVPPLVPTLIKQIFQAKTKGLKEIYGGANGKNLIDLLYVNDAAKAIILALAKYNQPEPLNIGSGYPITIRMLFQKIVDLIGYKGKVYWDSQKNISRRYLDITKAKKILGFVSMTKLSDGLKYTINNYLEHLK